MAGGGELAFADRPALFSLLPRTLFSQQDAVTTPAKSEEQELDAVRAFFKSTALSSSAKFIEEAKAISKSIGDTFKQHYEDGDELEVANAKDQLQGRRPALGRKRAHFSFKPNVSDSRLNVALKTSVEHIEDPDELFSAFENIECAKKELKKQLGEVASDSDLNHQRKRRPGILGRKASYRHHFPEHTNGVEAPLLSHGEHQIFSPSKNTSLEPMSQAGASAEIEAKRTDLFDASQGGFIDDKEKGVDNLLDTILCRFEVLNKGEEIDFLQERLDIKSTNVDKICLPPLDAVQTNEVTVKDSKSDGGKLDLSQRSRISPINKTPLAAISVLRRRISQIDPLRDPFLMLSSEKSTPESPFPDEGSCKSALSSPINIGHPVMTGSDVKNASDPERPAKTRRSRLSYKGKLHSGDTEAGITIPTNITWADEGDFHCQTDVITDRHAEYGSALDSVDVIGSTAFDTRSEDNLDNRPGVMEYEAYHDDGELPSGNLNCSNLRTSNGKLDNRDRKDSVVENDIHRDLSEIDGIMDDEVNYVQEASALGGKDQSSIAATTDIPMGSRSGNSSILPEQNTEVNDVQEAAALGGKDIPMGSHSGNSSILPEPNTEVELLPEQNTEVELLPEQNTEENQTDFMGSTNRPRELEACQNRQSKQRKTGRGRSLAGAGLSWQFGVRRSTRIKMKPLEYWRGERLLFARIHDSLPTVVGVKYSSPAKGGQEPVLKVKSYVSEEYADLVQKIALH